MNLPEDLQYTKTHEWVRREGDMATVGITEHAQDELGDVVFVDLPEQGAAFSAGGTFGNVESVKAVSDLNTPVGGEVVEINSALEDSPEKVNEDPYGEGWLLKIQVSEEGELLSAAEYQKVVDEES